MATALSTYVQVRTYQDIPAFPDSLDRQATRRLQLTLSPGLSSIQRVLAAVVTVARYIVGRPVGGGGNGRDNGSGGILSGGGQ